MVLFIRTAYLLPEFLPESIEFDMTINTGELITVIAESAYLVIEDQSLSQDIKLLS